MGRLLQLLSISLALLPAIPISTPRPAPFPNGGSHSMFSFDAFPEKADYLIGEPIRLKLRIANSGADALEFPDPRHAASDQPTIGIMGTSFPHGKLFNNLTALRESSGDPSFVPPAPPRIRIAPGTSWEGAAPITPLVQVGDPGEYRVRAALDYQNTRTTSKEARFQVHAVAPFSVHLGLGLRPFEAATGQVVFLQRSRESSGVYAVRFDETRPDIAEVETQPPILRATVSAAAADVAAPWRNAPFFNELLQWIVWREGHSIKALSSVMSNPLSADLPEEPAYLVQPPLKTTGGPVEVLAVSPNREEISLVEFASGPVGQDPSARVIWKDRLPAPPAGITAALTPVSRQSERHVALTVQRQTGFEIFHSRYAETGRFEAFQSVRVQTGHLLADAPPALFAGENGHAIVGVLATPDDHSNACTFAEAEFDAGGKPVGPARSTTFPLPGRANAGAVLYSQNQGGPLRLDLVVSVEGAGLLHIDPSRHLVPLSVQGVPTHPILLAPGAHVTYVLYADPKRGLYFEAL